MSKHVPYPTHMRADMRADIRVNSYIIFLSMYMLMLSAHVATHTCCVCCVRTTTRIGSFDSRGVSSPSIGRSCGQRRSSSCDRP